MAKPIVRMEGLKFGRWTVLSQAVGNRSCNCDWVCRCDCGTERVVLGYHLRQGRSKSCGCLAREVVSARNTTHADTNSKTYNSWRGMNERCSSPTHKSFANYGKRGVYVCERWRCDYSNFIADMGARPSAKHSIDRVNTNGSYTCGKCGDCVARGATANCRWATAKEQARNSRANALITAGGITATMAEWAERLGVSPHLLSNRRGLGMSDDEIINRPLDLAIPAGKKRAIAAAKLVR